MLRAIEAGVPITQACIRAGIATSVHHRAMEAGEQAQSLLDDGAQLTERQEVYRDYRERVLSARAKVAHVHVALVAKAAAGGQLIEETTRRYRDPETEEMVTETRKKYAVGDWRASKFLLEVSFRNEFGRETKRSVELTGKDGKAIEVAGDDVLRSISERLAAVKAAQDRQAPGGWELPAGGDDGIIDGEVVEA